MGLRETPPIVLVLGITGDGAPSASSSSFSFGTGEPCTRRGLLLDRLKNGGMKLRRRRGSGFVSGLGFDWARSRGCSRMSKVVMSRVGIPGTSGSLESEAMLLSSWKEAGLAAVRGGSSAC